MEGARRHDLPRAYDAREGGALRVSLSYDAPSAGTGKTTARTDTYHGRFVTLVPDEQIVEIDVFETDDPMLRGAMTITITLSDEAGGTRVDAVHDGYRPASRPRQRDRLANGAGAARGAGGSRVSLCRAGRREARQPSR